MHIQGNQECSCKLKFKEQYIIDRNPHQVHGIIQVRNGKTLSTLFGKWDESMHYVNGDYTGKGKGYESLSKAHLLWKWSKPPKFPSSTTNTFLKFCTLLRVHTILQKQQQRETLLFGLWLVPMTSSGKLMRRL